MARDHYLEYSEVRPCCMAREDQVPESCCHGDPRSALLRDGNISKIASQVFGSSGRRRAFTEGAGGWLSGFVLLKRGWREGEEERWAAPLEARWDCALWWSAQPAWCNGQKLSFVAPPSYSFCWKWLKLSFLMGNVKLRNQIVHRDPNQLTLS